jgi:hypothetical protein
MVEATNPDFIESAMYIASVGPFTGMYLASCARDRCGYMGKLPRHTIVNTFALMTSVVMDHLYNKSVHIKKYPRRGRSPIGERFERESFLNLVIEFGEQVPPRVTHASEGALFQRALGRVRPLKRSFAMLGTFINCCDLHNFD